jgi:predicted HD superfamily hydrolase involved in NAD metabolism
LHLDPSEFISSKTLHAPASAYIAEKEYGVEDIEILSSIRWHTIGRKNMTTFEKIIFIADKVETRTRDKDFLGEARELLETKDGLDKAILISYKETIKSLVERDLKICIDTIEIYNSLEDSINVN